jgi:apolipoprotein N-acyltransferase
MTTASQMSRAEFREPRTLTPQVPNSSQQSPGRLLLCALGTGALLWCSYFPLAWGWLAWVALVPLLSLVRSRVQPSRIYLCAWYAGLAFFVPILQWMRVADLAMYATWLTLALYCALYVPVAVFLIRRLDRGTRLPLVISVPVVWTALDFLRAHLLGGFAWYFLGHSQHEFLQVVQVADLAGVYAVTFIVAAVNAWLFELASHWGWFRRLFAISETAVSRWGALVAQGAVLSLLIGGTLFYGHWRLNQEDVTPGPKVALIQGNLDQRLKNTAGSAAEDSSSAGKKIVDHYLYLTQEALGYKPELLVWPETSWPADWVESPPGTPDSDSQWLAHAMSGRSKTNVLLGLNSEVHLVNGEDRRYNSALLIQADGKLGGRYDKIHRVPFGEFVPFRDWLPWMNMFAPYDFDYSITPGEQLTRFPLGQSHFGVVICFEDTDPTLARGYVDDGGADREPKADFLLNISNDGWFDGTSEHEEHLANCRFRAIESRRAVARVVNMGISAVIDANGRVLEPDTKATLDKPIAMTLWDLPFRGSRPRELPVSRWSEFKKVAGVLTAVIPIDHRASVYARFGDWLPWTCWLVIACGIVWPWVRPGKHS